MKNYDEAVSCYDIALSIDNNNANIYFNKGIIQQIRKNPIKALELFNKALDCDKNFLHA